MVEAYLGNLPIWLKKYPLKELLRAATDKDQRNPATTIPATRTMIIYDRFFKENNKKDILIHEISHISVLDLTFDEAFEFATSSGWIIKNPTLRTPPSKLLKEDSADSISEDYANHVEIYYSNPEELKKHNSKTFQLLDEQIKRRSK